MNTKCNLSRRMETFHSIFYAFSSPVFSWATTLSFNMCSTKHPKIWDNKKITKNMNSAFLLEPGLKQHFMKRHSWRHWRQNLTSYTQLVRCIHRCITHSFDCKFLQYHFSLKASKTIEKPKISYNSKGTSIKELRRKNGPLTPPSPFCPALSEGP